MRKNILFSAVALLCLNFTIITHTTAQQHVPVVDQKPLHIPKLGSTLPESFWQQEHTVYANGKTSKQTLAQFKDKLLILDFWATWCSSCTRKFKYLDSLQKEYKDDAVVILVDAKDTRDTPEKIAVTMKRFNDQLKTIILDTILTRQFVHTSVPHYIWIAGGHLLAATGGDFIHRENLNAVLNRQEKLKVANANKTIR